MAITIEQSPTTPNMANASLIYQISSNQTTQAQFQYVLDIQNASRTVLQRIKQQPNPSGVGVFDVGQILTNYVGIDEVWKTRKFATSSFANEQFWVAFGEEYGTSTSSSIVLYNGSGVAGAPAKSGSFPIDAANGLVEPNSGDWNFPSSSFVTMSLTPDNTASYYLTHYLTNAPGQTSNYALPQIQEFQKINDGDYATLSIYNGNFNNSTTNAQDVFNIRVDVYKANKTFSGSFNYDNIKANGGGPRTSTTQGWSDSGVYNAQDASTHLLHIGAGPQNFADNGTPLGSDWAYYRVIAFACGGSTFAPDAFYGLTWYKKEGPLCVSDGVRFAWKNEFGVWDYYTARLAINSGVQIERNSYQQSQVNYSNASSTLPYNISRRGTEQFSNKLNQSFNVTTDPLNQTEAEWLRELFFSTQVYVQEGTSFVPVVISNAEVIEKTNPRSQKIFQYAFDYQYANQLRARV